jgi:predicted phosphodiesterase
VVVGDTGIGDNAFHEGFLAVQKAMVKEKPNLVLHAGDYIYNKDRSCREEDIKEVEEKLVIPFNGAVVFARGDNDFKDEFRTKCWSRIVKKGKRIVSPPEAGDAEGFVNDLKDVFIAVLDWNALSGRRNLGWLTGEVEAAQKAGKWVIVAVHDPVVTTGWYDKACCESLRPLHDMGVDLVFSGHQHSFERTHQVRISQKTGLLERAGSDGALEKDVYKRGAGIVYIVTGGGGATLRPFADQEKSDEALLHRAPAHIVEVVAKRGIMNHYVVVELKEEVKEGKTVKHALVTTKLVCPEGDPRWKPNDRLVWGDERTTLACESQLLGNPDYDSFEIVE